MLTMFCLKSEMTQSWLFSVDKISDIALVVHTKPMVDSQPRLYQAVKN